MSQDRVLVIGSGGREHALAWKLAQSPLVERVYTAPGNAGTEWTGDSGLAPAQNVPLDTEDFPALIALAQKQGIGLTVVGPEIPLAAGIVDAFQAAGLRVFGPTWAAAQLEASKSYAKDFMREQGIPTGDYRSFTDFEAAQRYLKDLDQPAVLKASGLAAGKGVLISNSVAENLEALRLIMAVRAFGEAGDTVIVEERLKGPEVSLLAFCDGKTVRVMPPVRDHKRAFDDDEGPNTGGMGCFTPVPGADQAFVDEMTKRVLQPTLDGMAERGTPYIGVLYAGLMLTDCGPQVLEFNCRFGDPETQVILPLLASDLYEIMNTCIDGTLDEIDVRWSEEACGTVILASGGYPGPYRKGKPITGLDQVSETQVFHAGTTVKDGQTVTNGGRVLAVSATGESLPDALITVYDEIAHIHFDGMFYRRDIGRMQVAL